MLKNGTRCSGSCTLWLLVLFVSAVKQTVALAFIGRRGKSGLRWALHGVTPLHRKVRNSGTERMSRALILDPGTGRFRGAAGVKTAKLCREQDQIGKHFSNFG